MKSTLRPRTEVCFLFMFILFILLNFKFSSLVWDTKNSERLAVHIEAKTEIKDMYSTRFLIFKKLCLIATIM